MKRHYGKYVFPTLEKAQEMKDSLVSTEEKPNLSHGFGLIPEMTKAIYEQEEVLDEETQEMIFVDTDVILEESVATGKYQLDVEWKGLIPENIEEIEVDETIKPIYDHPYGWKMYSISISHEGNHGVNGFSYLKNKL